MKVSILLLLFLLLFCSVSAQTKTETEQVWNCDAMLAIFDGAGSDLQTDRESLVIIIAFPGKDEKSNSITQQRLKALEFYYVKKRGIEKERIILAEGRKRNGLAKVEFYVGGKLRDALYFSKNQRACTGCCPSEYDYLK